jgi:hypothetical protein
MKIILYQAESKIGSGKKTISASSNNNITLEAYMPYSEYRVLHKLIEVKCY